MTGSWLICGAECQSEAWCDMEYTRGSLKSRSADVGDGYCKFLPRVLIIQKTFTKFGGSGVLYQVITSSSIQTSAVGNASTLERSWHQKSAQFFPPNETTKIYQISYDSLLHISYRSPTNFPHQKNVRVRSTADYSSDAPHSARNSPRSFAGPRASRRA